MSKNYVFKKITILFTLIFSFLFCLIPTSNKVNAAVTTEVVYYKVGINELSYRNNTIYVKLEESKDVIAFTYEYAYLDKEGVKVSQLATCDNFKKLSSVDYSFANTTGQELVGIKLWKVQFKDTDTYSPDWLTNGNNIWFKVGTTGITGSQRLKTLQVTKNKLTYNMQNFDDFNFGNLITGYDKQYTGVLFFSLDNEEQGIIMDSIYRLEAEVVTYQNKWTWWGANWDYNVNRTSHKVEVYQEQLTETKRVNGVVVPDTPFIGSGLNDEGYDWYVLFNNQLKDSNGNVLDLSAHSGLAGATGYQTYLDEVAILNLTYVYNGEFFDVEVLDFGTGYTTYTKTSGNFIDRLLNWFNNNFTIVTIILAVIVLVVTIIILNKILEFFHLDKKSRQMRKMEKMMEQQIQMQQLNMMNNVNNAYIKQGNSNKKVNKLLKKNGKH